MSSKFPRALKRVAPFLAAIAVAAVFAACGSSDDGDTGGSTELEAGAPIKVGMNVELSGPGEFFGNNRLLAAKVAEKQINAEGGIVIDGESHPMQLEVCDNQTDATQAVKCAQEQVDQGVVWALTPDAGFSAAYEIYKDAGILSVANGGEASTILDEDADANPLLFFEFLTFSQLFGDSQVSQLANQFPEAKRLAVMFPDNAEGHAEADSYEASAAKYGLEFVGAVFHPDEATGDFTPFLTKLKALDPDISFLSYYPQVTLPSIAQATQLDVSPVFVTGLQAPSEIEEVDFSGHSVVSFNPSWFFSPGIMPQQDPGKTGSAELVEAIDKEAGGQPYLPSIVTEAYLGSIMLTKNAIEAANSTDGEAIAEQMLEASYDGPFGPAKVVPETHSADLAQNTLVWDEKGKLTVNVFDSGFDTEPSYSFAASAEG